MEPDNPPSKPQLGTIPSGIRVYAVGDIHGRVDLLNQVLDRIDAHLSRNPVERAIQIFLGDYVDRGPSSRLVIDRLIDRSLHHETVFLKGNHEVFMVAFLHEPRVLDSWRKYGGLETLISYGLKPSAKIKEKQQTVLAAELDRALPMNHKQFLSALQPYFICGDYFFVHAGIRPGIALNLQNEKDLLWIRDDFLKCEDSFEKVIVHGHTPVPLPEIRANRINIDTGAYATGILSCLVIEGNHLDYV